MYNCHPTLYSGSTDTAAAGRLRTSTRYVYIYTAMVGHVLFHAIIYWRSCTLKDRHKSFRNSLSMVELR